MANVGRKADVFHVRFRFQGKEYKKSLKTRDKSDAEAARRIVEQTIHRLLVGLLTLPPGVDPADFIVSGGTLTAAPAPKESPRQLLSTQALVVEYLRSQQPLMAPSYYDSQALHLRHLQRFLGNLATSPCDQVTYRDLDRFLKHRLTERSASTAERERITLLLLYKWAVAQSYLDASPAAALAPIKGGADRPPFRTISEIERIIARGGLDAEQVLALWECLYLTPPEIAGLLATVRAQAAEELSVLLHALPAYTGMRRGEVLRLRWLDVDFEQECLYARSRKQSRRKIETVRRIDLHPELKTELLAWRQRRPKGQLVICEAGTLVPISKDRANRLFWQPLRGTDWHLDPKQRWFKVGFHMYRHSFASNLAAQGVDQRVIDEFMGHRTEAMRRRYRHLFPSVRKAAILSFSLAQPKASESTMAK